MIDSPLVIKPAYEMRAADEPVELYRGPLEIDFGEGFKPKDGLIQMGWVPNPRIVCMYEDVISEAELISSVYPIKVPGFEAVVRTRLCDYHVKTRHFQPEPESETKTVLYGFASFLALDLNQA